MPEFISCWFVVKDKFEIESGTLSRDSIFYITKGEIRYALNGEVETAGAGDCVYFPSGVYFERKITQKLEFYHVRFSKTEKSPLPFGKIYISDKARLLSTLNYMCGLDIIHQEKQDLKNHFLRDILVQIEVSNSISDMQTDKVVLRAYNYFQKNLGRKISLEETAKEIGVSVPGLIGHFKATTGITPIKYLISLRIKNAETLLCNTDFSIAQISDQCGFENPYYFCNTFKKVCGVFRKI